MFDFYFPAWCKEKNIQTQLENMTTGQIDTNLRRFYAEARTKTGEMYSKSTLLGFRHAIERYLNSPPHNRSYKMSSDPRFKRSNEMLDAQIVRLKRSGKENVQHKPAIENEDLQKLKSSEVLSLNNPMALLQNVWFHVLLYFCRRGREGQRQLTTSSFKFEVDGAGRKYVTMAHDEVSKNHPGGFKDKQSTEKLARIYETDHKNDGYKALELYLSKVNPGISAFFQYPKRDWRPSDKIWYEARPLGVNTLASMMKRISEAANLSKSYTNHCVRATAITLWSDAGIPNRHIMAISGHRNEQSLVHYNSRPSTSQLHNCSEVLSTSLSGSSLPVTASLPATTVQKDTAVNANNVEKATTGLFGSVFSHCIVENFQLVLNTNSKTL